MRVNEPKRRLSMVQPGDTVILKGDTARRVFTVRESEYPGYLDLWIGKNRVVTAATSHEIEPVTP